MSNNLKSVKGMETVLSEKTEKERREGRMARPFTPSSCLKSHLWGLYLERNQANMALFTIYLTHVEDW